MNYTELKQEVADFIHRNDLTSKMDTFCLLAESQINQDLRTIEMEKRLEVTFDDTFYDLPDDYLEMRAVQLNVASKRYPIPQFSPQQLDAAFSTGTGYPRAFAIHGGQIELRPGIEATDPYDGELSYYAAVPTLTINASNDVLDKHPLLYLSAMMVQAHAYVQDNEELQKWASAYGSIISQVNKQGQGGRYVLPTVR